MGICVPERFILLVQCGSRCLRDVPLRYPMGYAYQYVCQYIFSEISWTFSFESPYWTKERFYWGLLAGFKFWNKGQLNAGTAIANTKARIQEQVLTGPNKLDFLATQFWQALSLITVIRPKMQFCLLAGLTPYSYISIVLTFISYSLSFSPTPSSFSSPFPQIHSPWKVHCEVQT